AQDALGQDPTRHHEAHCRRPGVHAAGNDRRPGHPGRDHRRAEDRRLRPASVVSTDAKAGPSVARARAPLVDRATATPAQLAVWDRIAKSRGRVAGPFAALLHSPELARCIAETGHHVRFEGPLAQAERELAIITVARALDCQYEWAAHAVLARRAGVREE